jgi:hypothetical protein
MRSSVLLFALLAGCGGAAKLPDGYGPPFSGAVQRYYVSSLALSTFDENGQPADADAYAVDLGGKDAKPDNALGELTHLLHVEIMSQSHVADVVAARAVDAAVEIQSDDPMLQEDAHVGVRWLGDISAAGPFTRPVGDQAGGTLHGGALTTTRIGAAASLPRGALVYPLFSDAAPSRLPVAGWQMTLSPDGQGGYDGRIQGVIAVDALVPALLPGFRQAIAAHPEHHPRFISQLDTNGDGVLTDAELADNGLVTSALSADVQLPATGSEPLFSFAAAVKLLPCDDDACTRPLPAASCFDRVRNGDETDVDCGGACGACAPGLACGGDADCNTGHCDGGYCRQPSCTDAVKDGFEIDIDCGPGCGPCVTGSQCLVNGGDCVDGDDCVPPTQYAEIGVCTPK